MSAVAGVPAPDASDVRFHFGDDVPATEADSLVQGPAVQDGAVAPFDGVVAEPVKPAAAAAGGKTIAGTSAAATGASAGTILGLSKGAFTALAAVLLTAVAIGVGLGVGLGLGLKDDGSCDPGGFPANLAGLAAVPDFHPNPDDLCRTSGIYMRQRQVFCRKPDQDWPIEVRFNNTGTAVWPRGDFQLRFDRSAGEFDGTAAASLAGWAETVLKLTADVQPGQTGVFAGVIRTPPRTGRFELEWRMENTCGDKTSFLQSTTVEVTCSDGVYCNGVERWSNGACVASPVSACDDGEACTVDTCDEAGMVCSYARAPSTECASVAMCRGEAETQPTADCTGKVCGSDGAGGTCGPAEMGGRCPGTNSCTAAGLCEENTAEGSCLNPKPLFDGGVTPASLAGQRVQASLDTSQGVFAAVATCNPLAISSQVIYSFTLPNDGAQYGLDARLSNNGLPTGETSLDTVLELRRGQCFDPDIGQTIPEDQVWCSDDATPPGGVGSRVTAMLTGDGATYYFICGGYSSETVGPAVLDVRFTAGYIPSCFSRFCGDDGHGGSCGDCAAGEYCDAFARCKPTPSSEFCQAERCKNQGNITTDHFGIADRVCGASVCGGTCGSCGDSELCQVNDGVCMSRPPVCDHLAPVCSSACAAGEFCASDCTCHSVSEPLPDLLIDVPAMEASIVIQEQEMDNITCAFAERCITGTGLRKLLKFDTTTINTGLSDLVMGDPTRAPWEYGFSSCHNHWHYNGYAQYQLLDDQGLVVAVGHKQGYCMQDSLKRDGFVGPNVGCRPASSCEAPGISRGYSDTYGNSIDCQWIDITGVPSGQYYLRVELNVERKMLEATPDNNVGVVRVTVP